MNKYLLIFLATLLIGSAGVIYAGTPCGTNLEYEIVDGVLYLTSPDPTQEAVIAAGSFQGNTTFTSFTLPANVSQIGSQAFMGCTALTDVELGSVQNISSYAFEGCTALTQIVLPPTVTDLGVHAFYGCTLLSKVYCRPQNAPSLGTDAFTGCADPLQICVPAKGSYNSATNWSNYKDQLSLCFLDETNDVSVTDGLINTFRSAARTEIEVFRTLRRTGEFNTLTLPFNVPDIEDSPLAGAKVYEFISATIVDGTLQLDITPHTGSSLAAGIPYLIRWENSAGVLSRMRFTGITSWDEDNAAEDAGTGDVLLQGRYGTTYVPETEQYLYLCLGENGQLYWAANEMMLGFRAWWQVSSGLVSHETPAALRIVSTPTAIERLEASETGCRKELINGQLIIIRNGQSFLINGQKL